MNTKTLLVSCLACCWLSMSSSSAQLPDLSTGQDYALFFAVNAYEYMDDLQNPIKNAEDIETELRDDFGFQTEVARNFFIDDKVTKQCSLNNTFNDDFIRIECGTYIMGCQEGRDTDCNRNEKPPHAVTISTFYLSKYEVTQAQWRAVMGSDPSKNSGCDACPVEYVNWNDTQEFLQKLNAQTGQNYRLPTEAEWEYAARGGNRSQNYLYSGSYTLDETSWYRSNYKKGNTHGAKNTTRPVGGKKPNELGLYDMSGNVWEWCSDWLGDYPSSPQQNPYGPTSGRSRVSRGGSWNFRPLYCRSAYRGYISPMLRYDYVGFRLAHN